MNFLKKIVIFSIAFIVGYTILQIYMSYKLSIELSPTLTTCVYGFFGTELVVTALLRILDNADIFKKNGRSKKKSNKE